jgi:CelD/BcsL family acetyltransferase involved in cellulose biosynthesis
VLPDAEFENRLHEGVSHSESVFRRQVAYLVSRFRFGLDLTESRELTLTFDDGYRNQHAIAHPILMQFGIKAYFFCTLDLLAGSGPLPIDKLLFWLSCVPFGTYQVRVGPGTQTTRLAIQTEADRRACWLIVFPSIMQHYTAVAPLLCSEFDRCQPFADIRQNIDPAYYALRFTPMLPQALWAMKDYGHLIGAHGKTHAPLSSLDNGALKEELRACAQEVGPIFNTTVFSFPFGGKEDSANDVRKSGFSHALSNINEPLPQGMSYSDGFIPRLALPNTAVPAEIDFILSGAKYFLQNFRLLPKVVNSFPKLTATLQNSLDDESIAAVSTWRSCGLPHPSVAELRDLARIAPLPALRVVKVHDGHHLSALAICYVERAVIHGVPVTAYRSFGDKLYDYTRLYAANWHALTCLIEHLRKDARKCGADVVDLKHQLVPEWLDAIPARYRSVTETKLFDAQLAPGGWHEILERNSIQRKWKKAAKQPGYRSETITGTFTRQNLEELAVLHRERWRFAGVRSAFENPRRLEEYLCHPANKVLTKVMLNGEMLCCHYGMLYENLLLWHTPVINVKYLDFSPLKILIAETAQFCSHKGVRYLDLGLGDESYKDYSANATRRVYEIMMPETPKGLMLYLLHRHGRPERVKTALLHLRGAVRVIKRAFAARLSRIYWYDSIGSERAEEPRHSVRIIHSYEDFVDFSRQHEMPILKYRYKRFKDGCFFIVLHNACEALSYGWGRRGTDFYVEEIDQKLFLGDRTLLFDFETPERFRRNGYYTELLVASRKMLSNHHLAIFARSDNDASNKGIRKAGFCRTALPPRFIAAAPIG